MAVRNVFKATRIRIDWSNEKEKWPFWEAESNFFNSSPLPRWWTRVEDTYPSLSHTKPPAVQDQYRFPCFTFKFSTNDRVLTRIFRKFNKTSKQNYSQFLDEHFNQKPEEHMDWRIPSSLGTHTTLTFAKLLVCLKYVSSYLPTLSRTFCQVLSSVLTSSHFPSNELSTGTNCTHVLCHGC